ncbi:hypothetical protein ACT3CD_09530 [Geofilum sp. OHC36d9]|uniref:hypothetical protein n=1 Tax=Geofilum sp. OHC36d9 TaxID=3458413 RepID=UPI004034CD46
MDVRKLPGLNYIPVEIQLTIMNLPSCFMFLEEYPYLHYTVFNLRGLKKSDFYNSKVKNQHLLA